MHCRAAAIGRDARQCMEHGYSWPASLASLDALFDATPAARRRAASG